MKRGLDALDKALIGTLFDNGRLPLSEIAVRLGISTPTVRGRLRQLVAAGCCASRRWSTPPNAGAHDRYRRAQPRALQPGRDGRAARRARRVSWAAVVTGRYDIIAEVVTTDGMNGLYDFLNTSLQTLGGVQSSEMFVVMKASRKWMLLPPAMTAAWTAPNGGEA